MSSPETRDDLPAANPNGTLHRAARAPAELDIADAKRRMDEIIADAERDLRRSTRRSRRWSLVGMVGALIVAWSAFVTLLRLEPTVLAGLVGGIAIGYLVGRYHPWRDS